MEARLAFLNSPFLRSYMECGQDNNVKRGYPLGLFLSLPKSPRLCDSSIVSLHRMLMFHFYGTGVTSYTKTHSSRAVSVLLLPV